MKKPLTIALILCSIGVIGQTKVTKNGVFGNGKDEILTRYPKGATTAELHPSTGQYLSVSNNNNIIWDSSASDTVAVYMLTTFKYANGMVPVRQTKGYSVTPRMAYNSLPRSTYLDIDKKPLHDIYIVWMSVPRKEECTCK